MPAIGGNYYRDHLPSLVLKQKKSQGGLTTGDKVIVEVTLKRHKKLSSGHGEWNRDMAKVYSVQKITFMSLSAMSFQVTEIDRL